MPPYTRPPASVEVQVRARWHLPFRTPRCHHGTTALHKPRSNSQEHPFEVPLLVRSHTSMSSGSAEVPPMLCGMWTLLPSQHKCRQCLLTLQSTPEQPKPRTGSVKFLCSTHRISLKETRARYLRPLQKVRHRGHGHFTPLSDGLHPSLGSETGKNATLPRLHLHLFRRPP